MQEATIALHVVTPGVNYADIGGARRWQRPVKAAAFATWVEFVQWRLRMRAVLRKSVGRMRRVAMAAAFSGWKAYTARQRRGAQTSQISGLEVRCCCQYARQHSQSDDR